MPITYHVVMPFDRDDEGNLVPAEPAEAPSAYAAQQRARAKAIGHAGAVAFSRTGDPREAIRALLQDIETLARGQERVVSRGYVRGMRVVALPRVRERE